MTTDIKTDISFNFNPFHKPNSILKTQFYKMKKSSFVIIYFLSVMCAVVVNAFFAFEQVKRGKPARLVAEGPLLKPNPRNGPIFGNAYYHHPKYRYPYYDSKGVGRLAYGYGGRKLYEYTTFTGIEGFYRRKR